MSGWGSRILFLLIVIIVFVPYGILECREKKTYCIGFCNLYTGRWVILRRSHDFWSSPGRSGHQLENQQIWPSITITTATTSKVATCSNISCTQYFRYMVDYPGPGGLELTASAGYDWIWTQWIGRLQGLALHLPKWSQRLEPTEIMGETFHPTWAQVVFLVHHGAIVARLTAVSQPPFGSGRNRKASSFWSFLTRKNLTCHTELGRASRWSVGGKTHFIAKELANQDPHKQGFIERWALTMREPLLFSYCPEPLEAQSFRRQVENKSVPVKKRI